MSYEAKKMNYCYVTMPNKTGAGDSVLSAIKAAGVNLLAFSGFPAGRGSCQLDLVADKLNVIQKIAKKSGWKLSKPKKGFLIQGSDEIGACDEPLSKLAAAKISVTAADAVASGNGRYGMVLWVKPKDYNRAAKVLGATGKPATAAPAPAPAS